MKRFTETTKWNDPWFRKLSPGAKLLWLWLCDLCDGSGVVDIDLPLAGFQIGYDINADTLSELGARVVEIRSGKHLIPKFMGFQYGELSKDCRAHGPVFVLIERHQLREEFDRLRITYPKGMHTLKEKESDKVKDRGKGAGKGEVDAETIRQAYCKGDNPGECEQFIQAALDAGVVTAAEFLAKVQACTAAIRRFAPHGPSSKGVPYAKNFFGERKWLDPADFQHRWEAGSEKKNGAHDPVMPKAEAMVADAPPEGWEEVAKDLLAWEPDSWAVLDGPTKGAIREQLKGRS